MSVARSMAARTLGSGPNTVSLLASLIEPGTVLPGTYTGSPASSGRRRAVTSTAYVGAVYAMPPAGPGRRVGGGAPQEVQWRRARAAEWGSLLMSCPPSRGPEVQILSPPQVNMLVSTSSNR